MKEKEPMISPDIPPLPCIHFDFCEHADDFCPFDGLDFCGEYEWSIKKKDDIYKSFSWSLTNVVK